MKIGGGIEIESIIRIYSTNPKALTFESLICIRMDTCRTHKKKSSALVELWAAVVHMTAGVVTGTGYHRGYLEIPCIADQAVSAVSEEEIHTLSLILVIVRWTVGPVISLFMITVLMST